MSLNNLKKKKRKKRTEHVQGTPFSNSDSYKAIGILSTMVVQFN